MPFNPPLEGSHTPALFASIRLGSVDALNGKIDKSTDAWRHNTRAM